MHQWHSSRRSDYTYRLGCWICWGAAVWTGETRWTGFDRAFKLISRSRIQSVVWTFCKKRSCRFVALNSFFTLRVKNWRLARLYPRSQEFVHSLLLYGIDTFCRVIDSLQVRDEYRKDYDPGRGGWNKVIATRSKFPVFYFVYIVSWLHEYLFFSFTAINIARFQIYNLIWSLGMWHGLSLIAPVLHSLFAKILLF